MLRGQTGNCGMAIVSSVLYATESISIQDISIEDLECVVEALSSRSKPAHSLGRGRSYSDNQKITFSFSSEPGEAYSPFLKKAVEYGCKVNIEYLSMLAVEKGVISSSDVISIDTIEALGVVVEMPEEKG